MSTHALEVIAMVGLVIAIGSAMPDPDEFTSVWRYFVRWIYRTVKIVTFNLAKEAEKKGLHLDVPPEETSVVQPSTPPKENP